VRGPGDADGGPGDAADPQRGRLSGPAGWGQPQSRDPDPRHPPDSQQRTDRSSSGSFRGGPAPAGKEKVPELRHKYNVRFVPTRKDDEVPEAATSRRSRVHEEDNMCSIPIRKG
jgi:hypothetical protein